MRSITIDNDTRELTRLMSFTEELAKEYRLSHEEVMQLQLALEEVVVNIISYAYSPDAHELIYISAEGDKEYITLCIRDYGIAFDPTEIKDADVNLAAEERAIGGLGIYLIRQLVDTIEYRRSEGYNILRLTKILKHK